MKQLSSILAASAAMILLAACSEAPPPAPDTREADTKAIRDAEAASLAAFKTKDADKAAMLWADDATLAAPNMALLNGHAAILGFAKDMVADPNFSLDFASTTVEVSKASDYGYSRGTYTMGMSDPKTKKALMEKGKFVTVYKKQADGSWKATADIFNADAPAMAMPAAAKK